MHAISKGSRYNQIYIPRGLESHFEAGDIVEVRLLKKKESLHYSKHLKKLTRFKKQLIQEIFKSLLKYKKITQTYIIGSFLTTHEEYNDIDIVLISEEEIDEKVQTSLTQEYNLRFHVISIKKDALTNSLKECPLMRSMFYYYVSNQEGLVFPTPKINKNYIKFLLMLPKDILNIGIEGRILYDALRRVIVIEAFLKKEEIAPDKIDFILKKNIGEMLLERIKKDKSIYKKEKVIIREIILSKLKNINKYLNYE